MRKGVINMPSFDQTGPSGQGPATGRGFGPCGRGYGRRWGGWLMKGMGFGMRRRLWTAEEEKAALDDEEKMLEEELAAVRKEKEDLARSRK